jgi:hypothetical protein
MTVYSFVQTFTVLLSYYFGSDLSNSEYYYEDLYLNLFFMLFMELNRAAPRIDEVPPLSALVSLPMLASIIGQILIQGAFQVGPLN